jgi:hypothetical protein
MVFGLRVHSLKVSQVKLIGTVNQSTLKPKTINQKLEHSDRSRINTIRFQFEIRRPEGKPGMQGLAGKEFGKFHFCR